MRIRAAETDDAGFLARMLVVAADWRPRAAARSIEAVLADPGIAHYVEDWPRDDDFGFVAEDGQGVPIGAAWCRFFSEVDPSYGFVSPEVPELAIGVAHGARGVGVGRALLRALIDEARHRDISMLSLSVEVENPAMHLYTRFAFIVLGEEGGAATMALAIE